jgi:hypothetical protein
LPISVLFKFTTAGALSPANELVATSTACRLDRKHLHYIINNGVVKFKAAVEHPGFQRGLASELSVRPALRTVRRQLLPHGNYQRH